MTRAALSSLTKTLVAAGLLTQLPEVADGRAVSLALGQEGTRQLTETFLEHDRREADWASAPTAAERAALTSLLSKLSAARQQRWVSRRT